MSSHVYIRPPTPGCYGSSFIFALLSEPRRRDFRGRALPWGWGKMGRTGALNPRSTAPRHHGRQARPVRGGLTPVGAEKSALTGSERGFQGLRAAACSFSRILQPVTHPPGSVSRETRLQVNLARRSTPAAAARRSGGHLQELHFLRRGRCPPQLALAGLAHTRIFGAEAGEGDRRR